MAAILKWLFAGLGWAMLGPIGGILGYYLGRSMSSKQEQIPSGSSSSTRRPHQRYHNTGTSDDLNAALLVLIAAVMKADGVVRQSELGYVKRFLLENYGEERAKELLIVLRDITKNDIPVEQVCIQIKVNTDYDTRYHMLDFLFGIALSDNEFVASEELILRRIATALGINSRDYLSIHSRHTNYGGYTYQDGSHDIHGNYNPDMQGKDPYAILGLRQGVTKEEVKKAYRRLAMKYHPDKVANMSEEVQKNAARQFREINAAYEQIMKS